MKVFYIRDLRRWEGNRRTRRGGVPTRSVRSATVSQLTGRFSPRWSNNSNSLGPVLPAANMSPAEFQRWFPVTGLRNFFHVTNMDGHVDIQPAGGWRLWPPVVVPRRCQKVTCQKLTYFVPCFYFEAENGAAVETVEPPQPPQRMTRQQILTLISIASVNFSSMICYSILGPFFPNEVR